MQADGKIVAAGLHHSGVLNDVAIVRYTTGGRLDASFGASGKVLTRVRGSIEGAMAVVVQPDSRIVAAGDSSANGSLDFALLRYMSDGKLDQSFGKGGMVLTDLGGKGVDAATSLALQADGKIVAAGEADEGEKNGSFALVRYMSSGRLDAGFGRAGRVVTALGVYAAAVVVQADGKIVATGPGGGFALARYTSIGRPDVGFGRGGKVLTSFGNDSDDQPSAVAVQDDGKIVVAGYSNASGSRDFALVRYTAAGKLDATFGRGGKVRTSFGAKSDNQASGLAIQKDAKIVVAGTRYTDEGDISDDFALARYTK